eukprot:TRINITY_DN5012_c4_g1_i1.p1 TRINITY_DN5012_c4_g1~~TRINITY_DN5012_c4_g1_i1.p1  ORF type:complete len:635 (+),score=173.60 TRINITY_DN5012_c4_g1_i1:72-1907(+)
MPHGDTHDGEDDFGESPSRHNRPRVSGGGQMVVHGGAIRSRSHSLLDRPVHGQQKIDDVAEWETTRDPTPAPRARRRHDFFSLKSLAIVAVVTCAALSPLFVPLGDYMRDPDEVTIRRDAFTRRFGYVYDDRLLLGASEENTPAKAAGLSRFIGRQITHVNRIIVNNMREMQDVEARVGDVIQLRFAPSRFAVGVPVRATHRILFQSSKVIEAGAIGVVTKTVGETEGSVAEVKIGGIVWDAMPGQVEVAEMTQLQLSIGMPVRVRTRLSFLSGQVLMPGSQGVIVRVPGDYEGSVAEVRVNNIRFDAMPGQLEPVDGSQGQTVATTVVTEEVTQLLEALGHQNYLPRLVAYGIDRLDFLASAEDRDGAAVGVKPLHWRRITSEAKRRAQQSSRGRAGLERMLDSLGEKELLPKLVGWGFDRVDYLARATAQDADAVGVKAERWQRVLREAKRRVNDTSPDASTTPAPREAPEALQVKQMLTDLGFARLWRRVAAVGLDDMRRLANAPNLTSPLGLDWPTWRSIQKEAKARESGHVGAVDPEVQRADMMKEYEGIVRRFTKEDSVERKRATVGAAQSLGGGLLGLREGGQQQMGWGTQTQQQPQQQLTWGR